jgi:mRNA interferase MazF
VNRGDVYRFNLDPTVGSEIHQTRMCVIVQRLNTQNSPVLIVCPITDAHGRSGNLLNPAIPAGLGGTTKDSRIAVHQIRALDKRRIVGSKSGELPSAIMDAVGHGLRAILDL